MSLVRLLGFTTLGCGCVVGRYREVATSREVNYVEEKGNSCRRDVFGTRKRFREESVVGRTSDFLLFRCNQAHSKHDRLNRLRKSSCCHSERSEESL